MGIVQRGIFGSSVWLGFMMSDEHLRIAAPYFALAMVATLIIYATHWHQSWASRFSQAPRVPGG